MTFDDFIALAVIAALLLIIARMLAEALGRFADWVLDVEGADLWR